MTAGQRSPMRNRAGRCAPPTGPGAVLAATEGGEGVSFSSPLGSQCCGCSSLRTPGPLRSTRGNARSAGTALLLTRRPSALPAGQKNGWTGLDRDTSTVVPTVFIAHQ